MQTKCKKNPLKVLISRASAKIPLMKALEKALKKIDNKAKVVACDLNENVLSAKIADEFFIMPATIDSELDIILKLLLKHNISIILPTRDNELMFWSRHKEKLLKKGITVLVSDTKSLNTCLDKLEFFKFGNKLGLPFIQSSNNLNNLVSENFVVKERFGSGSNNIGLNLNYNDAVKHAKKLKNPIYQSYIAGDEFSVDAWVCKNHKVKGLVLRNRLNVINGESQITKTFTNPKIENLMIEIVNSLKLKGPIVLQAILDKNEDIHVIECNARFGGASTAGIAVGLDSLYWSILEVINLNINNYPFSRFNGEVTQVRISTDIYQYDSNI